MAPIFGLLDTFYKPLVLVFYILLSSEEYNFPSVDLKYGLASVRLDVACRITSVNGVFVSCGEIVIGD